MTSFIEALKNPAADALLRPETRGENYTDHIDGTPIAVIDLNEDTMKQAKPHRITFVEYETEKNKNPET